MSCKAKNCYMYKTCLAKRDLDSHEHHCGDYVPIRESAYEKTKRQVYATGNKWAIENFHATHD